MNTSTVFQDAKWAEAVGRLLPFGSIRLVFTIQSFNGLTPFVTVRPLSSSCRAPPPARERRHQPLTRASNNNKNNVDHVAHTPDDAPKYRKGKSTHTAKHHFFASPTTIKDERAAVATVAPADNLAVRAPSSSAAGTAPAGLNIRARRLQDWEVEDIVLLRLSMALYTRGAGTRAGNCGSSIPTSPWSKSTMPRTALSMTAEAARRMISCG